MIRCFKLTWFRPTVCLAFLGFFSHRHTRIHLLTSLLPLPPAFMMDRDKELGRDGCQGMHDPRFHFFKRCVILHCHYHSKISFILFILFGIAWYVRKCVSHYNLFLLPTSFCFLFLLPFFNQCVFTAASITLFFVLYK